MDQKYIIVYLINQLLNQFIKKIFQLNLTGQFLKL
jgi:hypothetical protein